MLETEATVRSSGTLARKGRNGLGSHDLRRPPRQRPALQLRNLDARAPVWLREELAEDYRRMVYAESRTAVEQARARFTRKWRPRCLAVVEGLEEAGNDPFTLQRSHAR